MHTVAYHRQRQMDFSILNSLTGLIDRHIPYFSVWQIYISLYSGQMFTRKKKKINLTLSLNIPYIVK